MNARARQPIVVIRRGSSEAEIAPLPLGTPMPPTEVRATVHHLEQLLRGLEIYGVGKLVLKEPDFIVDENNTRSLGEILSIWVANANRYRDRGLKMLELPEAWFVEDKDGRQLVVAYRRGAL